MLDFLENLSGPAFIIVSIIIIILCMAVIGYFMEKNQKAKEERDKRAYIDNKVKIEQETTQVVEEPKTETTISINEPVQQDSNMAFIPNPNNTFFNQTQPMEQNTPTEQINNNPFTMSNEQLNQNNVQNTQINNNENTNNEVVENKIEVIDFGSTSDVKIDN